MSVGGAAATTAGGPSNWKNVCVTPKCRSNFVNRSPAAGCQMTCSVGAPSTRRSAGNSTRRSDGRSGASSTSPNGANDSAVIRSNANLYTRPIPPSYPLERPR